MFAEDRENAPEEQEETAAEAEDAPAADAEDAPVEEAAAEEAAVEEAAPEDLPDDGAPAEAAQVEEEPAEEAAVEEAAVEEAAVGEAAVGEAPAGEGPAGEGPAEEAPVEEAPAEEAPADEAPALEAPAPEASASEKAPAPDEAPAAETGEAPAAEAPKERPKRGRKPEKADEPDVIPGAHLEPDLVLDEAAVNRGGMGERSAAEIQAAEEALAADGGPGVDEGPAVEAQAPQPVPTTVLDLAADARYRATGKRKSAVARVTLSPGTGIYTVNGRQLDQFFPRPTLQRTARGPLETVGHEERMDVVAKIHGGGVSSQAGALRHGIARALVEADPSLRGELKRHGFLTRDPRVKERKKAGLKKARKRPQFSKR